jgi:predicted amino acid-binding ACT domain protein
MCSDRPYIFVAVTETLALLNSSILEVSVAVAETLAFDLFRWSILKILVTIAETLPLLNSSILEVSVAVAETLTFDFLRRSVFEVLVAVTKALPLLNGGIFELCPVRDFDVSSCFSIELTSL